MKQYEYLAAGISIVNDICFADGSRTDNILGGCCVYAMSGIGCFTESVLPVTAGGPDFEALYGQWFTQNAVERCGVHITMPATHHTRLSYEADGRWSEVSLYGDGYFAEQKQNNMTRAAQLLPHIGPHSKGLYLDSLADDGIWQELQLIRSAAPQLRIMWEPPTMCSASSDPATKQAVREHILACDFYSMNLGEAEAFFGVKGRDAVLAAIAALGRPCFLREGENGATWAENGDAVHLPALLSSEGIDPTGCGNCSTAAALWARCEGYGAAETVALASAAASLCARQRGPSPIAKLRASGTAMAMANRLLPENGFDVTV